MTNSFVELSRKDVSAGVEKKGGLSYLSWSFAWSQLCEVHPDANFYFADPVTFADGSVMVKAVVTVGDKTHEMTLPCMDHRNKAIQNPNARDISDAQMRCLVKCIALFGLGISLYLGEGLSHTVAQTPYEKAKAIADSGDPVAFHQYIKSLSERDQVELFNQAPMGQKQSWKNEHRALMKQAEDFLDSVVDAIGEAVQSDDAVLLAETIDELSAYERTAVWGRLTTPQQEAVKQLRTEQGVSA
jgi:hypothetical protein